MIHWLLTTMEENPDVVFCRKELLSRFPGEFDHAVQARLLRSVPRPRYGERFDFGLARSYLVVQGKAGPEAIDEEDPEAEPIPLLPEDLELYALNLDVFAERVQRENGLAGRQGFLDERLFFIGETTLLENTIAYVLALLNDSLSVQRMLSTLPSLLPRSYRLIRAVCPSRIPAIAERNRLDAKGVEVALMEKGNPFLLPRFHGVSRDQDSNLQYFHDLEQVIWNGTPFKLTPRQNETFNILFQARRLGGHDVPWDTIKNRLVASGFSPDRMAHIFRKSPLRPLIVSTSRGMYHLKH